MLTKFFCRKYIDTLDQIFMQMVRPENKKQEMIFSSGVIDDFCKEYKFTCYQFAHTPEGNTYMRIRMKDTTAEYVIIKESETQGYNAYLSQISKNGQLVYRRPDTPIGTIRVIWLNINQ